MVAALSWFLLKILHTRVVIPEWAHMTLLLKLFEMTLLYCLHAVGHIYNGKYLVFLCIHLCIRICTGPSAVSGIMVRSILIHDSDSGCSLSWNRKSTITLTWQPPASTGVTTPNYSYEVSKKMYRELTVTRHFSCVQWSCSKYCIHVSYRANMPRFNTLFVLNICVYSRTYVCT